MNCANVCESMHVRKCLFCMSRRYEDAGSGAVIEWQFEIDKPLRCVMGYVAKTSSASAIDFRHNVSSERRFLEAYT